MCCPLRCCSIWSLPILPQFFASPTKFSWRPLNPCQLYVRVRVYACVLYQISPTESPRVYVIDSACCIYSTLNLYYLSTFTSDLFVVYVPTIPHFLFILCIFHIPHPFSHQKLIPYGHVQAFDFTHGTISFSQSQLWATHYHLPILALSAYHLSRSLLTIRQQLHPHTR